MPSGHLSPKSPEERRTKKEHRYQDLTTYSSDCVSCASSFDYLWQEDLSGTPKSASPVSPSTPKGTHYDDSCPSISVHGSQTVSLRCLSMCPNNDNDNNSNNYTMLVRGLGVRRNHLLNSCCPCFLSLHTNHQCVVMQLLHRLDAPTCILKREELSTLHLTRQRVPVR